MRMPVSILMTVLFPAPFGPMKPRISPFGTSKEMPSTALTISFFGLNKALTEPLIPGSLMIFLNSFRRFSA